MDDSAVWRGAQTDQAERNANQVSLFGELDQAAPRFSLPLVEDWPMIERLQHELEAIGFYLSAHPLDVYASSLERLGVIPYARLATHLAGGGPGRVKLVGSAIGRRERTSQKGSRYAFVQFSDTSGVYEVVMFSEVLSAARDLLDSGAPLLLSVDARLEDDALRIAAQGVRRLDEAVSDTPKALRVYLGDSQALQGLKSVMQRDGQGKGRIAVIVAVSPEREVEIALGGRYGLAPPTQAALKAVPGVIDVREV